MQILAYRAEDQDENVLSSLRENVKGIHPDAELRIYSAGHEGYSTPVNLSAPGINQVYKWSKNAIKSLAHSIKKGTKLFINHAEGTVSHEGRKPVGEVLTSYVKEVSGKLHSYIVGYFPKKKDVKNMDFCSIEADIATGAYNNIEEINEVTGIALGSTEEDSPAFPGARLMATMQCFSALNKLQFNSSTSENTPEDKTPKEEGNKDVAEEKVTVETVKTAVSQLNLMPHQLFSEENIRDSVKLGKFNLSPSDLFSMETIKGDKGFSDTFKAAKKLEDEHKKLQEANTALTAEHKKLKGEYIAVSEKSKLSEKVDKMHKEGEITSKMREFTLQRYSPDSSDDPKLMSEEDIDKFISESKKEYTAQAKFWGVKDEDLEDSTEDSTETSTSKESATRHTPRESATGNEEAAALDYFLNRKTA